MGVSVFRSVQEGYPHGEPAITQERKHFSKIHESNCKPLTCLSVASISVKCYKTAEGYEDTLHYNWQLMCKWQLALYNLTWHNFMYNLMTACQSTGPHAAEVITNNCSVQFYTLRLRPNKVADCHWLSTMTMWVR